MRISRRLLAVLALVPFVAGGSAICREARGDEAAAPPASDSSTPPPQDEPIVEPPLAGFHNGLFYLRSQDDVFRLYVMGRVHVDAISWFGPGVSSLPPASALKSTFFLRRARPELAGEFFHDWQWQVGVDLAPTSTDNASGATTSLSCPVDPLTGAQTCANQANPVEASLQKPAVTDAFVNYGPSSWTNIQVGQYLLPFTMENRVSDNTTPFLERSIVARDLGAPFTRDLGAMFWGESPNKVVYYTVGAYNGDGPNRTNADSRFDYVGRAFVRPFFDGDGESVLHDAQIGISGRYGSRDPRQVGYDAPALTTQGGYSFWRPTYKDSLNRTMHIIPSAEQGAVGADIYVPVNRFDLTSEAVYSISNTREAADGFQLAPTTDRLGTLKGYAYYVQVGAWLVGSREIVGLPSYGKPLHADLKSPDIVPRHGLQALAKVEQLHLTYEGSSRGGVSDSKTPNGDIDLTSLSLGINYWATRHMRVALNYVYYDFPSSEPTSSSANGGPVQSAAQRALAPAQSLPKGLDNQARDNGHTVHELSLRFGVQF